MEHDNRNDAPDSPKNCSGRRQTPPQSRIACTIHGRSRSCQRRLPDEALQAALDHGRWQYCGQGRTRHWLSHRCVAKAARDGLDLSEHEGVVVIAASDGRVITAWRHREGQHWRRKPTTWKRRHRKGGRK